VRRPRDEDVAAVLVQICEEGRRKIEGMDIVREVHSHGTVGTNAEGRFTEVVEMIEKKFRLKFNDSNVQDSVSYILVTTFDIVPVVLQAKTDGSGGRMVLSMKGREKNIENAIAHLRSIGIEIETMENYVRRDETRCIDCGSCISVCPTFAFALDRETWDVVLAMNKCMARGFCLSACPTHAISLKMNL
jgi:ferredoxin